MASCLISRYRGLAVLVRSYRVVFAARQCGVRDISYLVCAI